MEYLDIYTEEGEFIRKEERSVVHKEAYWHKTVHCWLFDKEGNAYFQIRTDKQKLYTTASGHVQAGETVKEAFGREIKEEIGYDVDYNQAKLIDVVKFVMDREEEDGSIFRDRAFANVYACLFTGTMEEFDFDEAELAGVVKVNAKDALEVLKNESGTLPAKECVKENGKVVVRDTTVSFEDFLVNKGETAVGKYGFILEFIGKEFDK